MRVRIAVICIMLFPLSVAGQTNNLVGEVVARKVVTIGEDKTYSAALLNALDAAVFQSTSIKLISGKAVLPNSSVNSSEESLSLTFSNQYLETIATNYSGYISSFNILNVEESGLLETTYKVTVESSFYKFNSLSEKPTILLINNSGNESERYNHLIGEKIDRLLIDFDQMNVLSNQQNKLFDSLRLEFSSDKYNIQSKAKSGNLLTPDLLLVIDNLVIEENAKTHKLQTLDREILRFNPTITYKISLVDYVTGIIYSTVNHRDRDSNLQKSELDRSISELLASNLDNKIRNLLSPVFPIHVIGNIDGRLILNKGLPFLKEDDVFSSYYQMILSTDGNSNSKGNVNSFCCNLRIISSTTTSSIAVVDSDINFESDKILVVGEKLNIEEPKIEIEVELEVIKQDDFELLD